jgi:hypothetical protein
VKNVENANVDFDLCSDDEEVMIIEENKPINSSTIISTGHKSFVIPLKVLTETPETTSGSKKRSREYDVDLTDDPIPDKFPTDKADIRTGEIEDMDIDEKDSARYRCIYMHICICKFICVLVYV